MHERIIGTTLPVLELSMAKGERVIAVAGELSWMNSAITMRTSAGIGGGFLSAIKRATGGGSVFLTEYTSNAPDGLLAFATRLPGHILPVDLDAQQSCSIHRHGFLCGTPGVEISVAFQRSLGAGIFGGEGFILQKLGGSGRAWIELDGEIVLYELKPGETLRVRPGHVGMFESSVRFGISRIRGIRNVLFGADGIFLAALTGPGKVWLQSLPLRNLAHALRHYLTVNARSAAGGGNLVGSIFSKVVNE